jgi:hypothetical protein
LGIQFAIIPKFVQWPTGQLAAGCSFIDKFQQSPARSMGFQAAIEAAGTSWSFRVDDHVPDFPYESQVIPIPELAIKNETATNTSSQSKPNPAPYLTTGSNPTFADAEHIGIIFQQDWKSEAVFEFRAQRIIPHGRQIGRKNHPAPLVIDLSGNAETDPNDRATELPGCVHLSPALRNEPLSRLPDTEGNAGSGFLPPKYTPRLIDQSSPHMSSAQIHSNKHLIAHT